MDYFNAGDDVRNEKVDKNPEINETTPVLENYTPFIVDYYAAN